MLLYHDLLIKNQWVNTKDHFWTRFQGGRRTITVHENEGRARSPGRLGKRLDQSSTVKLDEKKEKYDFEIWSKIQLR